MKNDSLTRYVQLHAALLKEKAALESRLTQINRALGTQTAAASSLTAPATPAAKVVAKVAAKVVAPAAPRAKKRGGRRRLANPMTLKEAMVKATSASPLTKPELLNAIKGLGYKFTGDSPMNSINVRLYTKGLFKKHPGGKFSAIK